MRHSQTTRRCSVAAAAVTTAAVASTAMGAPVMASTIGAMTMRVRRRAGAAAGEQNCIDVTSVGAGAEGSSVQALRLLGCVELLS